MTGAWMWARSDLRARWRSWLVLGLLAGATVGLAAAGVAGARRTATTIPRGLAASPRLDAAVLPNDPAFDAEKRDAVAALPEVAGAYPFVVPFFLEFEEPAGVQGQLLPTTPAAARALAGVLMSGRFADPDRPDEIVIDENIRDRHGVDVGSTMVIAQRVPPGALEQLPVGEVPEGDLEFSARLRVVGVQQSFGGDESASISSGFYERYGDRVIGPINMFVSLRGGEARSFEPFRSGVQEVMGKTVAVSRGSDFLGLRQVENIADVETSGLLLFALAVLVGGGVLVGQALVRAVTASAADVPVWRSLGADRRLMTAGMVIPAFLVAAVGAVITVLVAFGLSSRFPMGSTRAYEIDLGAHADWPVLLSAALVLVVATLGLAAATAWWRTVRLLDDASRPSAVGEWAARAGLPPALVVGARLAVEPGRGRRAVPVRSALVGAIAGVVGVVGCLTFRAGIDDTLAAPQRAGIVWDSALVTIGGPVPPEMVDEIADIPGARAVLDGSWARAIDVDGIPTPMFGIQAVTGRMPLVVLSGRAPVGRDEVAFAPTTMRELDLAVGDEVRLGAARTARVVGTALLPETSHTSYDQSGWMTRAALDELLVDEPLGGPDDLWGFELVRWDEGAATRGHAELRRIGGNTGFVEATPLPNAVEELDRLRALPLALAVFFGLLALATVGHALVTTVRRRRHDLAIMRSFGLTGRQSRIAIAWQATLLAVAGVVVGVPLGIVVGRWVWHWLASDFPIVYVPPIELVAVVVVVPVAILVVNALAAVPGRSAARIRPAEALRVE
jgi:hypothetical protein